MKWIRKSVSKMRSKSDKEVQGVARNLLYGGQKKGSGDFPQRDPGAEPRWRSRGEAPEAGDTC